MLMREPKAGFLPDHTAAVEPRSTRPARWYDRLLGVVLRRPEPASLSYRYMARLIEREFSRQGSGVCLTFTSTDTDDATTDALLMLAYCIRTELDSRVLVIDARLRDQDTGITGRLGLAGSPGYAEVMRGGFSGNENLIQPTNIPGVDVLPAGEVQGFAAPAIDRGRLEQLMDAARSRYSHVLVQVGSVLRDTRNVVTAAATDAVFLLAEEHRTFMKALDDCRHILLTHGVTDVRVVVTGGKL